MFGRRLDNTTTAVALRATLAVGERELGQFAGRLRDALLILRGPDGATIAEQAIRRARMIADLDAILTHTRY